MHVQMVNYKNTRYANCESNLPIFVLESSEESEDDLVPEIKSFTPPNNYCTEKTSYISTSFDEGNKNRINICVLTNPLLF